MPAIRRQRRVSIASTITTTASAVPSASSRTKTNRPKNLGSYTKTLKKDRLVDDSVYDWAFDNFQAQTEFSRSTAVEAAAKCIKFFKHYRKKGQPRKKIYAKDLMLHCSNMSGKCGPHSVENFYVKKILFLNRKVEIELNGGCIRNNVFSRTVTNPFHNPGHNEVASLQRDDVATCNYPNCLDLPQENTKYCAVHQELMGVFDAEVSSPHPFSSISLTLYPKGRGDFSFFLLIHSLTNSLLYYFGELLTIGICKKKS
jgi:hypothetical protein